MKAVIISDTHSYHRRITIPDADLLIHCGDISWRGELDIIEDFCNWLKELPIAKKVVIQGNHEIGLEHPGYKRDRALEMLNDAAIYLEDSETEIDGIKFWGSPVSPFYFSWAFNRHRGKDIQAHWDKIPENTNVLITHSPPMGILDTVPGFGGVGHVGCQDLLNRIKQLPNLKLHCSGHLHSGYGHIEQDGVLFVNGAICTESYAPTNLPIEVEITKDKAFVYKRSGDYIATELKTEEGR